VHMEYMDSVDDLHRHHIIDHPIEQTWIGDT